MKANDYFKTFSIILVFFWLTVFALFAWLLVFGTSFMSQSNDKLVHLPLTLTSYQQLFQSVYWHIFQRSLIIAGTCTLLCILIGYPFAYLLTRAQETTKGLLLLLLIIPFWTSSLIRSYTMIAILKTKGLLNTLLMTLGLIDTPLQILFTNTAVLIGLIYNLLPFMIFPLYANLERLDRQLIDAARDLGANSATIFYRIIFPLSMPGIIAGSMMVFLPAMTMFYVSDLLGGAKSMLLGNLIQFQFLTALDWPIGSATSVMLTAMMGILIVFYRYSGKNKTMAQDLI